MDGRDDEVSTALRHLRPRPGFVATHGSDHEGMRSRSSRGKKRAGRCTRGYASVRLDASRGVLLLAYLHVRYAKGCGPTHAFVQFEMTVDTKLVRCVHCSAPTDSMSDELKSYYDDMCKRIRGDSPKDADESLFSIASRLLQLLNSDIPSSKFGGDSIDANDAKFAVMIQRCATTLQAKRPSAIHRLLDLQTLLIRCAAAGRNRSLTCAPVPGEFAVREGDRIDAVSHLVFDATNRLYLEGFGGNQQPQPRQRRSEKSETAWTLLGFLLSLPWTGGSRLVKEESATRSNGETATNGDHNNKASSKSLVGRLCLDIGTALGDPPPAFAQQAREYGTVQAYHGTKIESVWSILNYGLQNLSFNKHLEANGAMLGEGVYLSSSRRVAESFAIGAAEQPPPTLFAAFQHEALLHLLFCAGVDVSSVDPLESYDIKCLPVFEATIIKPPAEGSSSEGKRSKSVTRQEGKYFVCSDSEFVRITKLHLTIELSKKSDVWHRLVLPRLPVALIVLLAAIIWAMR
ncbi:hypothetical protein ACHAXT_000251 [Thalassiosira profunda]